MSGPRPSGLMRPGGLLLAALLGTAVAGCSAGGYRPEGGFADTRPLVAPQASGQSTAYGVTVTPSVRLTP